MRKLIFIHLLFVISSASANCYYVNNLNGNDTNSGLSPYQAWKSLNKVNSLYPQPNDSILFIRNGIWRGQLLPKSGNINGNVTYADYGTGEKPLFLGSENKSAISDWINAGSNIWNCSSIFSTDIGNIIFNQEESFGKKKWNEQDLIEQGDFWYDRNSGTLKIYSALNPSLYYREIELAMRKHIINHQNTSFVEFCNLSLKYGGAHGFGGGSTHHLTIRKCDISFIGGGDLFLDGRNIRFGNGIEFWGNAHDNIVEQCKIGEIYDTGLTNQNHDTDVKQYNIYYRNNIIYKCGMASYEYWNKPSGSTTSNVRFENNTCYGAGQGWSMQRPDRQGAHILLSYNEAQTDSIFIRNNIFHSANASIALPFEMESNGYTKLEMNNNCYFQPSSSDTIIYLFFTKAFTTQNFGSYQELSNQDKNSQVTDPLLNNPGILDFHLSANSPCINKGVRLNITEDFDGEIRNTPDIGADEYNEITGVNPVEKQDFKIFPNPVNSKDLLHLTGLTGVGEMIFCDALGQIILRGELKQTLLLPELKPGIYIVIIKLRNSDSSMKKILIKN